MEDFAATLPETLSRRGGVIMPMWRSEALWIKFCHLTQQGGPLLPLAVKVAAGKVNAVSGGPWSEGLERAPQDYMVCPPQRWIDGFVSADGGVRQFVAVHLGDGLSVEERITGGAEWGGIQISVTPPKRDLWGRLLSNWAQRPADSFDLDAPVFLRRSNHAMGLSEGGNLRQEIFSDPFDVDDWDVEKSQRIFVTVVPSRKWSTLTSEPVPSKPVTRSQYKASGIPWRLNYDENSSSKPAADRIREAQKIISKAIGFFKRKD